MNILKSGVCALATVAALTLATGTAQASHLSHLHEIDTIDHTFGAGGGSFSGALSSGTDDDWLVFEANAGDSLTIAVDISNWYVNAVLLQDTGNGIFEVGDGAHVTNFNSSQVGNGSPLQVLAHIGPLECFSGNNCSLLNYIAPYTGQYGIGLNSANESQAFNWTVRLSGNTAITPAVPLPAGLPLIGAAFGLLGLLRLRRRA